MNFIIELTDVELKDIKLVRKYFGINDKSCHQHFLYGVIDKLIRKLTTPLILRSAKIDLLEKYSLFLEKHGYMDIDWKTEPPFAIDEFLTKNN